MRRSEVGGRRACRFAFAVLCALVVGERAAPGDDYQPGTPFAYLFDTGSPSARPLSARSVEKKDGWKLVSEDDSAHVFRGDAAFVNDRLAVVLRRQGPGAEVYSHTSAGTKARGVVMAAPGGAVSIAGIESLAIADNTPAAVELEVTHQADSGASCSASYRLTTGQAVLEMAPGAGADRLFVWCKPRYVVVPDFFGDDMVFTAETCDRDRYGLPAESFLIHLLEGGDAMLMCVWRSPRQGAHAVVVGDGSGRKLRACEVRGGDEASLWIALLEGESFWHEIPPATGGSASTAWKPPFAAKWRCDFLAPGPFAMSTDHQQIDAEDEVRFEAIPDGASVIAYPLDRNRSTPLTTFCAIDVLRNTLGVGPCQYILQTEGLASATSPTPESVAAWVERQFERDRAGDQSDEIARQLTAMVEHVRHAQGRIERYAALAAEVRRTCGAAESQASRALGGWLATLDRIDEALSVARDAPTPPEVVAEVVPAIHDLLGRGDALEEYRAWAARLHEAGARQDGALSRCRMAVRWLAQQARMAATTDPAVAAPARQIAARAEQFLRQP